MIEKTSSRPSLTFAFILVIAGLTPLALSAQASPRPMETPNISILIATQDTPASASSPALPSLEMVSVNGGSFRMGSTHGANEQPEHTVTLTPFTISNTEITRAQYQQVMKSLPHQISGSDDMPVTNLSWLEAVQFCNALSIQSELEPVYTISGKSVQYDLEKSGYRLPTEAEWEYAANAGGKSDAFNYAGNDHGSPVSWYDENSGRVPHPVGQKAANALGLFDMSGNAAEWCQDYYEAYSSRSLTDPTGPAKGNFRLVRGGSWLQNENSGRVSFRTARNPKQGYSDVGFRIVRR